MLDFPGQPSFNNIVRWSSKVALTWGGFMRFSTMLLLRAGITMSLVGWATAGLHAQVLYGSLTGNVADPSDAAVPNVKVEALNTLTGVRAQTTTDARGLYSFTNLSLGTYTITVSAPSFATLVQNNVSVAPNEVRRADFRLQIAKTSDVIEVSAAASQLQTDKSDVHTEITAQAVQELPYNGGQG